MNIIYGCATLRAIERRDMPLLLSLINDPAIEYMAGGESFPVSEESQLKWFDHYDGQKELRCMIELNNGKTIGTIGLSNIDYRNRTAEKQMAETGRNHRRWLFSAGIGGGLKRCGQQIHHGAGSRG